MIGRTLTIAWKELLHMRKDRVLIPFLIIGAVAELVLLAWATSQPIDNVPLLVADNDKSEASQALVQAMDDTDTLTLVEQVEDADTIHTMMDDRTALGLSKHVAGMVIPAGYGDSLGQGKPPEVQMIYNGAEVVSSREAQYTAEEVVLVQAMRDAYDMKPSDYEAMLPQLTVQYNENLEQSWYTLPAEAGLMFYIMTVIMAAWAISRERELGTYEQLLVMPFRSVEVIIGKALAPMIVGYGLFLSMLFLTTVVFGVPMRGSLALMLALAVVYLLAEIGKGVLLSLVSKTQLQAVLLVFVVAMVDMIFSGYAVGVETMPAFIQSIADFIPIRHWLIIMRGIMLKDAGIDVLLPHILALVALGAVILGFTAWQFRRRAV